MTSAYGTMQAFKKGLAWIGVVRSQYRSELQDRNLYGSDWSHGLRNPTKAWPSHPHRPNHANHPTHPSHHVNFPDHPDHPNNLISTLDHPDVLLNKAYRTHLGVHACNSLFKELQLKTQFRKEKTNCKTTRFGLLSPEAGGLVSEQTHCEGPKKSSCLRLAILSDHLFRNLLMPPRNWTGTSMNLSMNWISGTCKRLKPQNPQTKVSRSKSNPWRNIGISGDWAFRNLLASEGRVGKRGLKALIGDPESTSWCHEEDAKILLKRLPLTEIWVAGSKSPRGHPKSSKTTFMPCVSH